MLVRRNQFYHAVWVAYGAALPAIIGCGGPEGPPMGTAAGTVKIDGAAPSEPMRVEFFNPSTGQGAGAEVVAEGAYSLETPLPAGEYQVYFTPPPAPELKGDTPPPPFKPLTAVPAAYTSDTNTPLKKSVAEGENSIDLDVPAP